MHALIETVVAGTTDDSFAMRAASDAAQADSLLAEALRLSDPTDAGRARFVALVGEVERVVQPWIVNFGALPLTAWWSAQQRALHQHALAVFGPTGDCLVPRPLEPLAHGTPVLPSVARPTDLRWLRRW